METLLDIQGLSVDFSTPRGRVHALRNISISVRKGRILGVVGESGSGKSTLIWAVMRLLANNGNIEGGTILYRGGDVLNFGEGEIRQFRGEEVSMVFQDPMTSQIPVHDYRTQMVDIQYRRREIGMREKVARAANMMRRVGIPDPETRIYNYPHQFSGGMRQRAGIGMALLMDPALLITDEPTTALDVTMEAQIIHLIREARSEFGSTVMLVSHNLGLIAELCDEVVVMYAGEVVEHSDVRDIFFHPRHPYTRALLECDPALELAKSRSFPTIPGDVPDLHSPPTGCVFAARCPRAEAKCNAESPADSQVESNYGGIEHGVRCHFHASGPGRKTRDNRVEATAAEGGPPTAPVLSADEESGTKLLSVNDLRVRFRAMGLLKALASGNSDPFVDAVCNATISLGPGQTLGLVGESGAGKSTLGRAILGLVRAESGSIQYKGQELTGLSQSEFKRVRRQIAMMFQDPVGSLSPRRTVMQLLTEPFRIHEELEEDMAKQAQKLCDMVRLPTNFLSRYPHELSGGQARRVGVARALALNPSLVVADEPTAGLDVSVQGEILNLLMELQESHSPGYLLISHNLPVIRQVSDRLAIMYLGRIVEQGRCADVFERPAHPYSYALVRGAPSPDPTRRRKLVSIEGEVPSLSNRPSGCEFHPRCQYTKPLCRTQRPPETELPDGRTVMCHFPIGF